MRLNSQKKPKRDDGIMLPHGFEKAYYNCNLDQMREVGQELREVLGWSRSRFYHRMRGLYSFTQEEIKVVESVFSSIGLDAWTGERTFTDTKTE